MRRMLCWKMERCFWCQQGIIVWILWWVVLFLGGIAYCMSIFSHSLAFFFHWLFFLQDRDNFLLKRVCRPLPNAWRVTKADTPTKLEHTWKPRVLCVQKDTLRMIRVPLTAYRVNPEVLQWMMECPCVNRVLLAKHLPLLLLTAIASFVQLVFTSHVPRQLPVSSAFLENTNRKWHSKNASIAPWIVTQIKPNKNNARSVL